MTGVLAIETATEACSVAVFRDGRWSERHEILPRQHNQRLFGMLRELLPAGNLREGGIEAIAYGCGPGSFTGLRIAASAVQGLCFAADLPAVAVGSLACQANTAMREHGLGEGEYILSAIDARINEIYSAVYRVEGGRVLEVTAPLASAPEELDMALPDTGLHAVGSGCRFLDRFPRALRAAFGIVDVELLPRARDMIVPAVEALRGGKTQVPAEVQPIYVREEISWRKLPEQGKQR